MNLAGVTAILITYSGIEFARCYNSRRHYLQLHREDGTELEAISMS